MTDPAAGHDQISIATLERSLGSYPFGFEDDHAQRSTFVRDLTLWQLGRAVEAEPRLTDEVIPRILIQYWSDADNVPPDVRRCMDSWQVLLDQGFALRTFDDASALRFITERYGPREVSAFARCRHPAMRSDYLRMCFVLAEGGIYVDADDVLVGDGWQPLLRSETVKVQALCYDVQAHKMVDASELERPDMAIDDRIFYVNNNPLVAPAGHPVLLRALTRATGRLLSDDPAPEIQSTTGPGNMTASVAAHARDAFLCGARPGVELLLDWNSVASTRWELSYRADERNWRNMDQRGNEG